MSDHSMGTDQKETLMRTIKRPALFLLVAAAITTIWIGAPRPNRAGAATPMIGCPGGTLTVRTGQRFYHTVVVSDVVDLYAWQTAITYNATYLSYEGVVIGDFLIGGGAAQYTVKPSVMPGRIDDLAVTRLGRPTGQDGSGAIAYLSFTALKQVTSGTSARVTEALLADRNALAIEKNYIDSGYCRVIIRDDAPVLIQPPIGTHSVYVPLVLR